MARGPSGGSRDGDDADDAKDGDSNSDSNAPQARTLERYEALLEAKRRALRPRHGERERRGGGAAVATSDPAPGETDASSAAAESPLGAHFAALQRAWAARWAAASQMTPAAARNGSGGRCAVSQRSASAAHVASSSETKRLPAHTIANPPAANKCARTSTTNGKVKATAKPATTGEWWRDGALSPATVAALAAPAWRAREAFDVRGDRDAVVPAAALRPEATAAAPIAENEHARRPQSAAVPPPRCAGAAALAAAEAVRARIRRGERPLSAAAAAAAAASPSPSPSLSLPPPPTAAAAAATAVAAGGGFAAVRRATALSGGGFADIAAAARRAQEADDDARAAAAAAVSATSLRLRRPPRAADFSLAVGRDGRVDRALRSAPALAAAAASGGGGRFGSEFDETGAAGDHTAAVTDRRLPSPSLSFGFDARQHANDVRSRRRALALRQRVWRALWASGGGGTPLAEGVDSDGEDAPASLRRLFGR